MQKLICKLRGMPSTYKGEERTLVRGRDGRGDYTVDSNLLQAAFQGLPLSTSFKNSPRSRPIYGTSLGRFEAVRSLHFYCCISMTSRGWIYNRQCKPHHENNPFNAGCHGKLVVTHACLVINIKANVISHRGSCNARRPLLLRPHFHPLSMSGTLNSTLKGTLQSHTHQGG